MSATKERVKIITTKIGIDGHDRGVKVVTRMFMKAGFEVVYLGLYQTPESIVKAAIQEDADVVGISSLDGTHLYLIPKVVEELNRNRETQGILLLVGGVIPAEDVPVLEAGGVARVFVGGSAVVDMVDFINSKIAEKKANA